MKHSIFILLAGAFLIIGTFISCRGKVTISGDNGTDTIVFNTDSIKQTNINVQVGNQPAKAAEDLEEGNDTLTHL